MAKEHIRSLRYSEEVRQIVESIDLGKDAKIYDGKVSFNDQFEKLCLDYRNTIPERERALKEINKKIAEQQKKLDKLNGKLRQSNELDYGIESLKEKIKSVNKQVDSILNS